MKGLTQWGRKQDAPCQRRGSISSGCLLFLLLMIALGYVGLKVGAAYWSYFEAREKIREALVWAAAGQPKSEEEIVGRIIAKAREVEVELSSQDIRLKQGSDTLTANVTWVEDVEFPYYTLPLRFKVSVTKERRWPKVG